MNNSLLNIITGRDRKQYNQIIRLIEQKNYNAFFDIDIHENFGLSNGKYVDKILKRIEQEIYDNPNLLIQMNQNNYHRVDYFNEAAVRRNPKIIESLINSRIRLHRQLIVLALSNGYMPTEEFINKNISFFSDADVMEKLVNNGYRPSNELIEDELINVFSDEKLLLKALDWGFVPSENFISKNNLLDNPNLIDRIFNLIELTPEILNSKMFFGNAKAQQKIIKERPDLLLKMSSNNASFNQSVFEQFWLEAFKMGYMPEEIYENYYITSNFLLFSKIIKQKPEMIKYCKISKLNRGERNKIDELALCMGYVPNIADVISNDYIRKSSKLMQALILERPEAIKYIETRPFENGEALEIQQHEFFDLVRLALNNGYIPTLKDIENNPRLADSFDIMKILIQDNPELINMIRDETPNKEELLKIAIQNGFNGEIAQFYNGTSNTSFYSASYNENKNELLSSETAIIYRLDRGLPLTNLDPRGIYSIKLYNYLIDKGYQTKDIINLFNGNFEVMKVIIAENPNYINAVRTELPRKEIDELGKIAIDNGYVPKFEDEIFGHGAEIIKQIVELYPAYLEKVQPYATFSGKAKIPNDVWLEICKIASDAGFIPDVETMGDGFGGSTKTYYNDSYEIMKKAIPLKPELIESCSVADKEKYDELCRLAISCGYEITNEYALTHWGQNMCTNYDLMAQYIAENPMFILNVQMSNSDEMLKLIDIAQSSGLSMLGLSQNQLFKLFLPIDESKWSKYLDSNTILSLQSAKQMYVHNDEISDKINPNFLKDEIASKFTKEQMEILCCYPKLQEQILKSSSDSFKFNIILDLVDKYKDKLEWIPILENTLNNINSSEYINLLSSVSKKELSTVEKENLMYLLMTNNHLDISNFDELKNIDSIRENYIQTLIERDTLGSLKTAYFEKVFGIDLSTAINFVNLYGRSLESKTMDTLDEESKSKFILVENMKKIININNIDLLRDYVDKVNHEFLEKPDLISNIDLLRNYIDKVNPNFVVKPDLMVTYEAQLKYLFTRQFNESFTKPLEEDKVNSNVNGEQDLDIYLAAGHDGKKKCRMMITSIGAYTNMDEPDDYYASWNVNKIASHGCCCSYVGEKNLGTAEVKYCCLGFTDYELGALQLSGPYDLGSESKEDSYEIYAMFSSMYLLPDDILDHTRHTHNETVWERRNISAGGTFKKQPSYVVYFVDNFEDRLTDAEAMKQWESVKKAANNFSIEVNGEKRSLPIMVIEREKIAQSQLGIINDKLEQFKETLDSKLIKDIISDYESNYAGNREYHLNISEKYFPKCEQLSDSVVGEIIETIEKIYKTNPDAALECIYELEKTVRAEQEKYNNTQHGVSQSDPSFNIEEALISINELKSNFKMSMDSSLAIINSCDNNQRQFEQSDVHNLDQSTLDMQLSSSDVISLLVDSGLSSTIVMNENEIKEEKINSKLKVHGQRHIKNVVLYSALIGQSVVKDKHDLDLIIASAKYHDIGRSTDAYDNHAEEGAKIVLSKLKDKYSKEDLAIISTIIEFHETPRNIDNDEIFNQIATQNGLSMEQIPKVKQMAEVLKDADALDRTRFINRARLNPSFLQYDVSKKLIKFASTMQETYAIQDLKEFHCDEEIGVLLQFHTPQEVLRNIRHSTRGYLRNEDIQEFIKSWANYSIEQSKELQENYVSKEEGVIRGR